MKCLITVAGCLALCLPALAAGPEWLALYGSAAEFQQGRERGISDNELELHYDGECAGGMTVNQYPLTWAVRVTPSQAYTLVAVRYYQWDEPFPVTEVRVYDAGSTSVPGALVRSQSFTPSDTGWNRADLDSVFPVIANRDFWVSVHMDRYPPTPCIGRDAGPIVTSRNYVYVPGYGWNKLESISGWANMCCRAVVETGTGVEEVIVPGKPGRGFTLEPTLARDRATLRYSLPKAGPVSVTILDVAGRTVLRQSSIGNLGSSMALDLRGLSAGVYLVRLDADGYSQGQKLVVER